VPRAWQVEPGAWMHERGDRTSERRAGTDKPGALPGEPRARVDELGAGPR